MALNLLLPIAGVGLVALLAYSSSSSSTEEGGGGGGARNPPGGGGGGGGGSTDYVPTAAEIKNAQQCLIIVGLLPAGSADGKMGPQTSAALKNFQVKYGLKDQSGKLTKETIDLVCEADSPVADLIKGGMTKEDANRLYSAGRAAGQNAASSSAANDPTPYYYAASADTAEKQAAFDKGFAQGYSEAKAGGAGGKSVSDPTNAAAAKKKGYDNGYANGYADNKVDASDSFDASGLAGEYPSYKDGYNSGYAAGLLKGKQVSTAQRGTADGKADALAMVTNRAREQFDKLGWGEEWWDIYRANYNSAYLAASPGTEGVGGDKAAKDYVGDTWGDTIGGWVTGSAPSAPRQPVSVPGSAAHAAGRKAGASDVNYGVPRRRNPASEIGGSHVVNAATHQQFSVGYNEGYAGGAAVMGAAAAAAQVFPRSRVQMGAPPVARPRGVRYHEDGTPYLA